MQVDFFEPTPEQHEAADALIRKWALYAMGCSLLPLPVVDVVAVTALEVQMIRDMSQIYGFKFPRALVTTKVVLSLLGSIAPVYFTRHFKNAVKLIPGVGYVLSAALLGIANGASVYGVGKVFQRHFESGGVFLSTGNSIVRRFFKQSCEEGKAFLSKLQYQA